MATRKRGAAGMDDQNTTQPFSSFVPDGEDDSPSIPRRPVNGWVKRRRWDGREDVFHVQTVRVFEAVMAEQVYPPPPPGHIIYLDMFPRGRLEVIPEAEAHAWLSEHGLPVPG